MKCNQIVRIAPRSVSGQYPPQIAAECQLIGLALWPQGPDEPTSEPTLRLGVQVVMTNRPDVLNTVLHDFTF